MTSTQPRVQRKRAAHAPLHVKRILTSSHLAEEVHAKAKGRLPRALPVRKGDTVRVMRGGFRGREGKVVSVDRVHGTVVVEGITIEKVDEKKVPTPLHASNLLIIRMDDTRGRMSLVGIEAGDATWKLCRVEDKTTVRGGKTQVNLHDGRNVVLAKDAYKTGTTLKIHVPGQKVVEHYELGKGAPVLVTAGKHVGQIAHVSDVQRTRNPRANIVTFTEGFSTDIGKVFVVGTEGPAIKTPEVSAI